MTKEFLSGAASRDQIQIIVVLSSAMASLEHATGKICYDDCQSLLNAAEKLAGLAVQSCDDKKNA